MTCGRNTLVLLFLYYILAIEKLGLSSSSSSLFVSSTLGRCWTAFKQHNQMGNIVRMMKYDKSANEKSAIAALNFLDQDLSWFRLDDGVMGGQSLTDHQKSEDGSLDFCGTINTSGGGFCSIRADFQGLPENTTAIRIRYSGDGKTYKFLLSDGTRGFSTPSWQHDIVTDPSKKNQTTDIALKDLKASMGPRRAPSGMELDASSIKEVGVMLSLKLSNGEPNPIETFGSGIFPFSLKIHSIEPITSK
eukprot:scaffold276_cov132-Cylindrotheca_fusiformis.AAC.13